MGFRKAYENYEQLLSQQQDKQLVLTPMDSYFQIINAHKQEESGSIEDIREYFKDENAREQMKPFVQVSLA